MKNRLDILGTMSGSSLDGMDLALIRFTSTEEKEVPDIEWIAKDHFSYPKFWESALPSLPGLSVGDWMSLDVEFSRFIAKKIQSRPHLIKTADFIGWHGHTSSHHPEKGWTSAIGNGQILASELNTPVIGEFRKKDVALGGQGAPLAPIVDRHFFPNMDIALNLGGIANMTWIKSKSYAFDIVGCNQILNHLAAKLGRKWDENGSAAASGKVIPELLRELNAWPYLSKPTPKSLDNKIVSNFYKPILDNHPAAVNDLLATSAEHITDSIVDQLPRNKMQKILLSGGGVRNGFLFKRLQQKGAKHHWIAAPGPWINFKEAFLMAYMSYLFLKDKNNVFSAWTGGKKNHCAGVRYNP
ncbi:MAG: hypothetical protein GVX96_00560 [Bacteroidetes bacterium]|jgi:anhydro-N-acetylmuramic acid kinase|nr:hypothetical protein [Bacteroidota bacterium]